MKLRLLTLGLALAVLPPAARAADAEAPPWAEPMKKVHARFKGTPGTFAHFGDSITVTMAFWSPLESEPKKLSPDAAKALALVKGYMKADCWSKWKGPEYGSQGSMTVRWAHDNIDKWLDKLNPEVAVILFGTNDLTQLKQDEYESKMKAVVERCLKNGTIVILTTIPPRSGHADRAREFAESVRKLARELNVPLIDYQAEVLKRRPDDWDGSLARFKDEAKDAYQVSTLIAGDGVHPSNPTKYNDYSEESLNHNGYALRSYMTLMKYAEVLKAVGLTEKK
jgi:lysophospholipase L1-like esterase